MNFLVPLGLTAVALAYFGKQKVDQLFNGLSFEPRSVTFSKNSLGLISTRFIFTMRCFNKSDVSVPIKSISGAASVEGQDLATFQVQKSVTIPANSYVDMQVDVTAGNLAVFILFWNIIKSKRTPKFYIKGGVYTLLGTAPFELVYDQFNLSPGKKA